MDVNESPEPEWGADVNSKQDETSDEQLMIAYQQGDLKAFERLYERHKGSLYRYFCRQIQDVSLAQDLYQELWSRIIKSSERYQVTAKWTTWVYTVAHNLVIDHVRAARPVESWEENGEPEHPQENTHQASSTSSLGRPEQEEMNRQLSEQLKGCIRKLPQAQQEVFLLNEETDLSLAMIADVVAISLEAAKSRLRYARAQLKQCLADYWAAMTASGGDHD
ncbi:sigma-70 family RNA polymerase sigma factor [Litoribrevibacter albus]|uniref:RNA polymerase subunit sigma-24 n=1 Tax=Litoribrevibacter albus TaxID=1473156 RepID=A0AA37SC42_9GAMM|nr:sigma-70 family RNA polymerase sigma factor [Litoribrevibacter albus]GLQ32015.1 RNA polymerase subunit sigma-24 [Litoribrevibacter albus]